MDSLQDRSTRRTKFYLNLTNVNFSEGVRHEKFPFSEYVRFLFGRIRYESLMWRTRM